MRGHFSILFVMLFALLTIVVGCQETRNERSPIMTEQVRARQLLYSPSRHGTGVGPSFNMTGDGGLGIAVTSVSVREKKSIVFECEHGQFVIERPELWKKLHQDSVYTCRYVELYRTVYDDDTLVSRELVDYDFLGLEEFPSLMEEPRPYYHEVK